MFGVDQWTRHLNAEMVTFSSPNPTRPIVPAYGPIQPIHLAAKQGFFSDINVSQGSVATYARCGGMFSIHFTENILRNLPVKKIINWLRFYRIMVMSLWPRFLAPL